MVNANSLLLQQGGEGPMWKREREGRFLPAVCRHSSWMISRHLVQLLMF